jgi:hypothetical protein
VERVFSVFMVTPRGGLAMRITVADVLPSTSKG